MNKNPCQLVEKKVNAIIVITCSDLPLLLSLETINTVKFMPLFYKFEQILLDAGSAKK